MTTLAPQSSFVAPSLALTKRELVRFFRQRSRIIGALIQPLIFWVLFGTGLGGSFRMPGVEQSAADQIGYMAYFVPGVAAMIVLFTAIFSTISIIEDRDAGFLQGVLASPSSRLAIVMGKIGGGAVIAILQAALFLTLAPVLSALGVTPDLGLEFTPERIVGLVLFVTLLSIALTGLGYCIAWPSKSSQGYHAIMSVFLFPMWLLSGAFFSGRRCRMVEVHHHAQPAHLWRRRSATAVVPRRDNPGFAAIDGRLRGRDGRVHRRLCRDRGSADPACLTHSVCIGPVTVTRANLTEMLAITDPDALDRGPC